MTRYWGLDTSLIRNISVYSHRTIKQTAMKKCHIECSEEQLRLIQKALDFYSRVGIGQFTEIKNHPTFEEHLYNKCVPKKDPEVGDRTPQGEILEVKDGKALINGSVDPVKKMWCEEKEWKELKDVKLSTDYSRFHQIREEADEMLAAARNHLIQDRSTGVNGSWGIYNTNVDESCRESFNMVKCIRHEFWKLNPNKSSMTVDSSVDSFMKNKIVVKIE